MIAFSIVAGVLVTLALTFVLWPLLRPHRMHEGDAARQANVAAYRQQVAELELDLRSGALDPEQHDATRLELERRLLEDAGGASQARPSEPKRSLRLAWVIGAGLPLAALLTYSQLGTPQALTRGRMAETVHGEAHGMGSTQIEVLAARLATRLATRPDDAEGWAMLARTYGVLGRAADAEAAYARAAALAPSDAQLLADYADSLAAASGGRLDGAPIRLVRRALAADPHNAKALALAGTAAFDRRRYREAVDYWQRAHAASGDDPEFQASLRASLEEARALAGTALAKDAPRPVRQGRNAATSQGASYPQAAISGTVSLAPALAAGLDPADIVFIFARAADGPRMPLAMQTRKVADLPAHFVLDEAAAMAPGRTLADASRVVVIARVSRRGSAEPGPGDVEGGSRPVAAGARDVRVLLDTTLR
jgi:cytochrome c-type biogenesis protein CcmH